MMCFMYTFTLTLYAFVVFVRLINVVSVAGSESHVSRYAQEKVQSPGRSGAPDVGSYSLVESPKSLRPPDAPNAVQHSIVLGPQLQSIAHCTGGVIGYGALVFLSWCVRLFLFNSELGWTRHKTSRKMSLHVGNTPHMTMKSDKILLSKLLLWRNFNMVAKCLFC